MSAHDLNWVEADPAAETVAVAQACPQCGHVGMTIAPRFIPKPIGSHSLAGVQIKMAATREMWITCDAKCGFEEQGKRD